MVGDAVLGAEPAPFPSPLPPASGGAGPSAACELFSGLARRTADSVFGRLIFSLSFAVPQFKMVTHKSSLRLSSGHSGLVLTLSNAARSSLFRPHLLVADAGVWGTFLLGVAFRHVICGVYLLIYLFFLPVRLPSEIRKLPPDPPVQDSPGRISVLSSFVSLFIFYVLSYLLSKTMGCFSGHLMTSASDQKLFCEVCSAFGYSFDEFVGEKVVSQSYSSPILAPPPGNIT